MSTISIIAKIELNAIKFIGLRSVVRVMYPYSMKDHEEYFFDSFKAANKYGDEIIEASKHESETKYVMVNAILQMNCN